MTKSPLAMKIEGDIFCSSAHGEKSFDFYAFVLMVETISNPSTLGMLGLRNGYLISISSEEMGFPFTSESTWPSPSAEAAMFQQ